MHQPIFIHVFLRGSAMGVGMWHRTSFDAIVNEIKGSIPSAAGATNASFSDSMSAARKEKQAAQGH
jgi:hypothetical protein